MGTSAVTKQNLAPVSVYPMPPGLSATYNDYPAIGSHTINWIEAVQTTFTATFFGQDTGTSGTLVLIQSGMHGEILG